MNVRNIEAKTKEPTQVTTRSILESRVAFCLERSKNIQSCLGKICGPDEITYLDNLCAAFVKENNKEGFESHISKIDKLQASIQKYENEVISLLGIGSTYESVHNVTKMVQKVLGNLEYMFCAVLVVLFYLELTRQKVGGSQGNFCIKWAMAGKFGIYICKKCSMVQKKRRSENHVLR